MAQLELSDGRQVHYEVSGPVDRDGPAFVFHHGQPGAALLWGPLVEAAAARGLVTVMLSRPGYATSERHLGRRVADVASDVVQVLDHLGVGRFVAAGWSGGGPHALACGALLGPRCAGVATIAGVAPYPADGLDWTGGMGPENVEEFNAYLAGDPGLEARIAQMVGELSAIQPDQLADSLGGLISEPDRQALEGDVAEFLAAWFRLSVSTGHYGYWDDDGVFFSPWGFELDEIKVPVAVWRADQDLMVSPTHGEWLADHIPGADGMLMAGEGHISLLTRHIHEIVADLVDRSGTL